MGRIAQLSSFSLNERKLDQSSPPGDINYYEPHLAGPFQKIKRETPLSSLHFSRGDQSFRRSGLRFRLEFLFADRSKRNVALEKLIPPTTLC